VDRALDGVDVVYHEAAEVGVGQSMYEIARYVRANDLGTAVLLDEIVKRRPQIKKLMVASSMSIYGEGAYACGECGPVQPKLRELPQLLKRDWELNCPRCHAKVRPMPTNEDKPLIPSSVYAISKQDQEQFCLVVGRAYNIPVVALRYFNVYGTRQALSNPYTGVCAIFSASLLKNQRPFVFEDGEQTRDFVHVSDIVQANLLALETDKADYQTLNVGTGSPVSINDISLILAHGLNKDIEPQVTAKYREGDIRHCVADITRARTLLGYEPKVKLADGIPELLEWVRQQHVGDTSQANTELEQHQLVR
jgi:dTDP-L-rhamnose 4-epimerase